VDNRR